MADDQFVLGLPAGGKREGGRRRDEALVVLAQSRPALLGQLDAHLRALYETRIGTTRAWVNGDDAVAWLRRAGFTGNRKIIGAVFGHRAGWLRVGWATSEDPTCHARPKACWRPIETPDPFAPLPLPLEP